MHGRQTGQVGIGRRLERPQPGANDERCAAEPAEGLVQASGPHAQSADAVQDKPEDEDGLVTKVAQDPVGIAKGGERVCAGLVSGGHEERTSHAGLYLFHMYTI